MKKILNTNTLLLIIIALLLIILTFKNTTNYVVAQGDGGARHIFGVVGGQLGNRQPFYLVDTDEQAIMVYEYFQGGGLGFVAARNSLHKIRTQAGAKIWYKTLRDARGKIYVGKPWHFG